MSNLDEKINKTSDDNSKVEVVIKRNENEQLDELDLLHIFVNMGRKKRIYAWLIIAGILLGMIVPLLTAEMTERPESVSAMITLNYPGAENMRTPDGEELDINFISTSYVIQNALNKTRLKTPVSVSAVANNLKLERLLTEDTRQNLEYMKTLMEKNTTSVPDVGSVTYKYENKVILTLSNDFPTGNPGKTVRLDGNELTSLLDNIAEEANDYFFETFSTFVLPEENISNLDMESLDYIEKLDSMLDVLNGLSKFCSNKDNEYYLYRSKLDGMTFKDINDCIKLVKDIDIDYLYAYVYYNCIAIDKLTTITKYEYALRNADQALKVLKENIDTNANVIANYKNENILVASQEGTTTKISSSVTDYYNELIVKQSEYYIDKADTQTTIDNLNNKIKGFNTSQSTTKQIDYVKDEIDSIYNMCCELYRITFEHAKEIIDSDFYRNEFITIIGSQYVGEGFFNPALIKKILIGAAVGAVLAVVVWCFDGLVMEFKLSNKKKEEREVEQ